MNVLYLLGSVPNHKHLFINREINELQRSGINIFLLVINPFYDKGPLSQFPNLFKAGFNPFAIIFSPLINLLLYKKSIFFSKSAVKGSKNFDTSKISSFRIFMAKLFLESAYSKLLRSKIAIDHIHSHHLFSASLFTPQLAKLTGSKYSITLHTLSHYFRPEYLESTLSQASFLRTVTTETEEYLKKKELNTNIHYIANGVDETAFPKRNVSDGVSKLSILAVGYFFDKKGFDILIKSCRIIKNEGIDFHCTIIGEGPEKKLLAELIDIYRLKAQVSILPFLSFEDLIPYFQNSSVLAVPSRDPIRSTRDGLPTVILEAMAIGLPVVASDFAGISDAIVHEKTGLMVKSGSDEDLAKAILRIYSDKELAQKIVKNSETCISRNFSLKKNISKLSLLFKTPS